MPLVVVLLLLLVPLLIIVGLQLIFQSGLWLDAVGIEQRWVVPLIVFIWSLFVGASTWWKNVQAGRWCAAEIQRIKAEIKERNPEAPLIKQADIDDVHRYDPKVKSIEKKDEEGEVQARNPFAGIILGIMAMALAIVWLVKYTRARHIKIGAIVVVILLGVAIIDKALRFEFTHATIPIAVFVNLTVLCVYFFGSSGFLARISNLISASRPSSGLQRLY